MICAHLTRPTGVPDAGEGSTAVALCAEGGRPGRRGGCGCGKPGVYACIAAEPDAPLAFGCLHYITVLFQKSNTIRAKFEFSSGV